MDENGQIQKELFEEFVKSDKKKYPKLKILSRPKRTIALSYEQLVFIVMAFIITTTVFFSLGVERGKRLKVESLSLLEKESKQISVQMAEVSEQSEKEVAKETAADEEETGVQPEKPPKKKEPSFVYTIQVASYIKRDSADKEASQLKKRGFEPFVLSSGNYYVVCVGEFENRVKASSEQKRLVKLYPDCYIKKK